MVLWNYLCLVLVLMNVCGSRFFLLFFIRYFLLSFLKRNSPWCSMKRSFFLNKKKRFWRHKCFMRKLIEIIFGMRMTFGRNMNTRLNWKRKICKSHVNGYCTLSLYGIYFKEFWLGSNHIQYIVNSIEVLSHWQKICNFFFAFIEYRIIQFFVWKFWIETFNRICSIRDSFEKNIINFFSFLDTYCRSVFLWNVNRFSMFGGGLSYLMLVKSKLQKSIDSLL